MFAKSIPGAGKSGVAERDLFPELLCNRVGYPGEWVGLSREGRTGRVTGLRGTRTAGTTTVPERS